MARAAFIIDPSWPTLLELATRLWGEPTDHSHDRNEYRFGAKQSKSIRVREAVWNDHETDTGGGYVGLWKQANPGEALPPRTGEGAAQGGAQGGVQAPPAPKANGHDRRPPWENVGVVYKYFDAKGALVLEVVRTIDGRPRFNQRRPNGTLWNGETKWKWGVRDLPGHDCLLYRLPELLASNGTVFVCEGEKDCDNLAALGLTVTTGIGGSGKWRAEYADFFQDRDVVVLPDFDPVGIKHAETVARSLSVVAHSLKVVVLPGLAEKGDVSDWLAAGGNRTALEHIALEAPFWVPPDAFDDPPVQPAEDEDDEEPPDWGAVPPPPDKPGEPNPNQPPEIPVIICQAGELPRMVREAEAALLKMGAPIYQRSVLVRPAEQEYPAADGSITHSAALVQITGPAMLGLLATAATWLKYDGRAKEFRPCDPPLKVVEILLANRGQWSFPVVRGVLTSPTIRPDGSLLMTPGYDPVSRYYLMFPTGLELPEIPETPTMADAVDALARLEALLISYDFIADDGVSLSVALAILMTQVLRCGMAVSPLLAVSATAPGSGKSHLIDLASTIAIGRPCPIMGAGRNDEETEKGINTHLISGVAGFSIDNVHRSVDLAVLNIATERPMVGIRLFGTLDRVEVENSVTIFMTGNNLPIVDEQVRRTVLCGMDSGAERPEQRQFDGDPIKTVLANRGRYIADVLIIARAYLAHGSKREDMRPFGSYPGWSRLVREPLIWLDKADPVASQNASRASDPEIGRLKTVMDAWEAAFNLNTPTTLADAVRYALASEPPFEGDPYNAIRDAEMKDEHRAAWVTHTNLRDVLMEHWGRGKDVDTGRWSGWMKRYAGRMVGGKTFRKGPTSHTAVQWILVTKVK